ncbi:MAG: hypothetical protein V4538_17395 [Bacteroidota bacterium]
MKKLFSMLLLCMLIGVKVSVSQINIQFFPGKEFNVTSDDLINFSMLSPVEEKVVDVHIVCKRKESGEQVFEASLSAIKINAQLYMVAGNTRGLSIKYSNSAALFNNSKVLSSGTYQICVELIASNSLERLITECEDYKNLPLNPPMLLYPEDKGVVNTLQPILNWIPPTPLLNPKSVSYQLKLVQLHGNQNQFEAIASNSAIFATLVQSNTNLLYPYNALPLVYDKQYAWQVEAFEGSVSLGKTEVWQFTIQRDSIEALKEKYRLLSFIKLSNQGTDSKYYETNEDLKIIVEGIVIKEATIQIVNATNQVIQKIEPADLFDIGNDRYVINLNKYKAIKANTNYTIQVSQGAIKKLTHFNYSPIK